MSRRGDRDSGTRRRPSLFDREPSPKRSKRDGKPASERAPSDRNAGPDAEQDDKHRRRLQDPLPLEAPPSLDPKIETEPTSKDLQKKGHTNSEDAKASSNPNDVPRSRSYFQHDDRIMASSGGRGSSRRSTSDRGWWKDTKEHVKASDRTKTDDSRKDDLSHKRDGDTRAWRHDGFFEMEANPDLPPPPPLPAGRRRPSFREQKVPYDGQDVFRRSRADAVGPTGAGRPGDRNEERSRHSNHWERPERRPNRRDDSRGGFALRERFGGGIRNAGRDTYNGRQGNSHFGNNDTPADKWKHDLYDEANKSPSPKKEEDRIAKIEALLAS